MITARAHFMQEMLAQYEKQQEEIRQQGGEGIETGGQTSGKHRKGQNTGGAKARNISACTAASPRNATETATRKGTTEVSDDSDDDDDSGGGGNDEGKGGHISGSGSGSDSDSSLLGAFQERLSRLPTQCLR